MGLTESDSKATDKIESIDPRCVVKFRPYDGWNGEYGFDWYRDGDQEEYTGYINNNGTKEPEKFKYVYDDIIGLYANTGFRTFYINNTGIVNKYSNKKYYHENFKTFNYKTIDIKNETSSSKPYYKPWLCISQNDEVKLKLCVNTNCVTHIRFNTNKKISIKYNNNVLNNKDWITIKPIMEITVKITGVLNKNQDIKVYATNNNDYEALAGIITVLENKTCCVEYCCCNVIFTTDNSCTINDNIISFDSVNKILKQACVSIRMKKDHKYMDQNYTLRLKLNSIKKFWSDRTNELVLSDADQKKEFALGLITLLLRKTPNNLAKRIIFLIPTTCKNIGGYEIENVRDHYSVVVIFKHETGSYEKTLAHEFLHTMGLYHTFDNKSDADDEGFAFRKESTNNIMDYGDGVILWKWQWDVIRKEMLKNINN